MSLISTQSSKRQKAMDAVRQKTPERYLPKLSKEEHVLPEGHPLSVLFDETLMRQMASPLKDSVLRTSLGAAIAGGCDIQASSIDRERIARLLDSLKSATLTLLQDASQYKRMSDDGGNPPRSLVSDLREDLAPRG